MEAQLTRALPEGADFLFEPKWDGFRCLCFRDGDEIYLQSKALRPLARYFPEIVAMLKALPIRKLAIDGELVIPVDDKLDFDQLLQRIHPAESRVRKLAAEFPARLIVFDLLVDPRGERVADLPLEERRARLERLEGLHLSEATRDRARAANWLSESSEATDGVIAKRLDCAYRSGERDGMFKVKRMHTADCVIGGYRTSDGGTRIASLLLGLYDSDGVFHYVGFTSSLGAEERAQLERELKKRKGESAFTGRSPGGPSRWSHGTSTDWVPVRPEIVLEVGFDHVTGGRFRHGTRALRFRPDKAPRQCTTDQMR